MDTDKNNRRNHITAGKDTLHNAGDLSSEEKETFVDIDAPSVGDDPDLKKSEKLCFK